MRFFGEKIKAANPSRARLAALLAAALFWGAPAAAADEAALAAARACASIRADGDSAAARGEARRRKIECLKDLYLQIAAPAVAAEIRAAIRRRLDALEAAYHAARNFCELQNEARLKKGEPTEWCGTARLSPAEFLVLLKTMIVNEDAGWVRVDPRLQDALDLK